MTRPAYPIRRFNTTLPNPTTQPRAACERCYSDIPHHAGSSGTILHFHCPNCHHTQQRARHHAIAHGVFIARYHSGPQENR